MRLRALFVLAVAASAVCLAGCGTGRDTSDESTAKAEQLVSALHAKGLSPQVSVDDAESLYGTGAPLLCDRLTSPMRLPLDQSLGGPSWANAPEERVAETVEYSRVVVSVYCPDELDRFEDVVKEWEL